MGEDRPRRRWRRRPRWRRGRDPQLPQPQPEARTDTSDPRRGVSARSTIYLSGEGVNRARNNLNAGDDQGRHPRCRPWGRSLGSPRHRQGSPSPPANGTEAIAHFQTTPLRLSRRWPR